MRHLVLARMEIKDISTGETLDMSKFTEKFCVEHNIVDYEMFVKLFNQGFSYDDIVDALEANRDTLDIDCYEENGTDYTACVSNCEEIARIDTETRKLYVTKHIGDLMVLVDNFVTRKDTDVSDMRDLYRFCENEGVCVDDIEGYYEI